MNKILFFADRFYYEENGRTLTGQSYTREKYGPVPAGLDAALLRLARAKKLVTRRIDFHGYPKDEFISLVEPDLSNLSKEEIIFLVKLADVICNEHTARSISEVSHDIVWNSAEEGETIPMNAYLVAKAGEIRQSDMRWAKNIVSKLVS